MSTLTFAVVPDGLVVDVVISPTAARLAELLTSGLAVPRPVWAKGVIDTGTNVTCVSLSILHQLGIPAQGTSSSQGVSGSIQARLFEVGMSITNRSPLTNPLFTPPELLVMGVTIPDVEVLIGRDVLNLLRLTADGPGAWFSLEW